MSLLMRIYPKSFGSKVPRKCGLRAKRWFASNRSAINYYNRHIEKHGAFSDKLRRF